MGGCGCEALFGFLATFGGILVTTGRSCDPPGGPLCCCSSVKAVDDARVGTGGGPFFEAMVASIATAPCLVSSFLSTAVSIVTFLVIM